MNVLTFPNPKRPSLDQDASLIEIFAHVETNLMATILFVDDSEFCREYVEASPWLKDAEVAVVSIDQDIQGYFELNLVPRFDFFINGTPLGIIIGTASQTEFLEIQSHFFDGKPLEVSCD